MRFKQMATATAIGLASGALAIGPAIAQQQSAQQHQQQSAQQQSAKQPSQEKIDIVSWAQRDLYEQGWTAEQLFDQTVYGQNGEEAGEVENLMIGRTASSRR